MILLNSHNRQRCIKIYFHREWYKDIVLSSLRFVFISYFRLTFRLNIINCDASVLRVSAAQVVHGTCYIDSLLLNLNLDLVAYIQLRFRLEDNQFI